MSDYHDFSIMDHGDGLLTVPDPPPIGALSAFSLDLLAHADRGISLTETGDLVVCGLEFMPVRLARATRDFGPPQLLVCERVA